MRNVLTRHENFIKRVIKESGMLQSNHRILLEGEKKIRNHDKIIEKFLEKIIKT